MSLLFTAVQLGLAVAVCVLVVGRARVLLYRAPLGTREFLAALRAALADGDRERADELAEAGRPAWVAEIARAALSADSEPGAVDELLAEQHYEAGKGLVALRGLASVSSALGFLGAIAQLIWLLGGDHGLLGLAAGRAESLAAGRALLAIALGVTVSGVAFVALGVLRRAARELIQDTRRVALELTGADDLMPPVASPDPPR